MTLFLTFFLKRREQWIILRKPNSDWHFKLNGFRNHCCFLRVRFQTILIDYFPGEKSSKIGNMVIFPWFWSQPWVVQPWKLKTYLITFGSGVFEFYGCKKLLDLHDTTIYLN